MKKPSLTAVRARIDRCDRTIVSALAQRARLAQAAGEAKRTDGAPVYDPAREAEVLASVLAHDHRPFPRAVLSAVYREIIGASRSLESPLRVAYLGPAATFTHTAAISRLGRSAAYLPAETIGDSFSAVEKGRADLAVVPIENAIEGVVVHTLDRLVDSPLMIVGEIIQPITHCLLAGRAGAARGGRPGRVRRILSHPQALAQCREWIEEKYPGVPCEAVSSTAAAAQRAAKSPGTLAIASPLAAETYDLAILAEGIESLAGNATRFLVLAPPREGEARRRGVAYKTSVAFSLRDRPGALFTMLSPFKKNGINLTKIESRPARVEAWRYTFFLDMQGHRNDPKVRRALARLEEGAVFMRILGSYPMEVAQPPGGTK